MNKNNNGNVYRLGMSLFEIAITLAIVCLVVGQILYLVASSTGDIQANIVADKIRQINIATNKYLRANAGMLVNLTSPGGNIISIPVAKTSQNGAVPQYATNGGSPVTQLPSLQAGGYIPANYIDSNSYGQSTVVLVRQPTAGNLEAMITTVGGRDIPDRQLGRIMQRMGPHGGAILHKTIQGVQTNTIQGTGGSWQTLASDWNAGSTGPTAGHIMSTVSLYGGTALSNYIYRNAIPGIPQANRMQTSVNVNNYDLNHITDTDTKVITNNSTSGSSPIRSFRNFTGNASVNGVSNEVAMQGGFTACTSNPANCGVQVTSDGGFFDVNPGNASSWITYIGGAGNQGIHVEGDVATGGDVTTNNLGNTVPTGYAGGTHTLNLYSNGALLSGPSGALNAYASADDGIVASSTLAKASVLRLSRTETAGTNCSGNVINGNVTQTTDVQQGDIAKDSAGNILTCQGGTWEPIQASGTTSYVDQCTNMGSCYYGVTNQVTGGYACPTGSTDIKMTQMWYGTDGFSWFHLCVPGISNGSSSGGLPGNMFPAYNPPTKSTQGSSGGYSPGDPIGGTAGYGSTCDPSSFCQVSVNFDKPTFTNCTQNVQTYPVYNQGYTYVTTYVCTVQGDYNGQHYASPTSVVMNTLQVNAPTGSGVQPLLYPAFFSYPFNATDITTQSAKTIDTGGTTTNSQGRTVPVTTVLNTSVASVDPNGNPSGYCDNANALKGVLGSSWNSIYPECAFSGAVTIAEAQVGNMTDVMPCTDVAQFQNAGGYIQVTGDTPENMSNMYSLCQNAGQYPNLASVCQICGTQFCAPGEMLLDNQCVTPTAITCPSGQVQVGTDAVSCSSLDIDQQAYYCPSGGDANIPDCATPEAITCSAGFVQTGTQNVPCDSLNTNQKAYYCPNGGTASIPTCGSMTYEIVQNTIIDPPTGITTMHVNAIIGGGGAGEGATGNGPGGGAGEYLSNLDIPVKAGDSISIEIGNGGSGSSSAPGSFAGGLWIVNGHLGEEGWPGGNTTISINGNVVLTAHGGGGGIWLNDAPGIGGAGGGSGAASGGVPLPPYDHDGNSLSGGGKGADSPLGTGGAGGSYENTGSGSYNSIHSAGSDATGYGAGGGGQGYYNSQNSNDSYLAGSGSPGYVSITFK